MGDELRKMLIRHEGLETKPYLDTVGKLTIGVGRNLTDVGISELEALVLLNNDIANCGIQAAKFLPWFNKLDSVRKDAILDMTFNIGIGGVGGFKRMGDALMVGDYITASSEMLDSAWAGQVGKRANELAKMMRVGIYVGN